MILSLFLTDFKNTIVVGVYSNRELQVLNKFFRKERKKENVTKILLSLISNSILCKRIHPRLNYISI